MIGSTDQFYVVNRTPVSCGVLRTEPNPTRRRGSWTSLSVDSSNVRKISQIFITDCPEKLRLEFDLDRLDSQLATITDVTFKNISSLVLKFSGIQRPRMTLVFTDINNLELSGNLPGRENKLEFFFRDCRRDRGTNIVINRMKIDGTVQLLNFQDIASLSVYDTDIASLQDVDFFQVDRCYNKISDFRPTSCTKQDLFQDQYPSTYWPPVTTDRTTRTESTRYSTRFPTRFPTQSTRYTYPTRSSSTDRYTYTFSSTENTPQPYISEVTSNPLFIVGMVILAALILIAIPVILFVRHQNRGGTWKVGWSSDNWFLRPSQHRRPPRPPVVTAFGGPTTSRQSSGRGSESWGGHEADRSDSIESVEADRSSPLSINSLNFQEANSRD